VGSGRGPPGVMFGRIGGGYDGRGGAGRVVIPPGPPGRARLPVGGGGGAVGRGGTTRSDGRRRGPAGRVGIAGTADVPGAFGSSILSLMLGGTIRPSGGADLAGAAGAAATGRTGAGGSATGGGSSSTTGAGSAALATGGGGASSGSSTGGGSSYSSSSTTGAAATGATATAGAAGFAVFTRRGGASVGAAGFAGSAFLALAVGFFAPGLAAGPSANMSPPGSVMLRSRASRSTNWRATTSSIVLDALLSSMPCARFSSASTSWLLVLRSSATL